jgi:hypothetical protein
MKKIILSSIVASTLIFTGCGSSSGDSTDDTTTSASGTVTDEKVIGATVVAYSDKDMSIEIGRGTTSSTGAFDINLSVNVPDTIYFKTTGGVNEDDRMPAPTMTFVGSPDSDGKFNISPISDMLYKKVQKGVDLSSAKTKLAGQFTDATSSFSESNFFVDPTADTTTNETLGKILASGTMSVGLSDGNYTVIALSYDQSDIDDGNITTLDDLASGDYLNKFNINITDGYVTGTLPGASIQGAVSGSSVLLNLIADDNSSVSKIAGTVGLFGSATGTFVDMNVTDIKKGVFAAQFIPEDVNYTGLETKIGNMIEGPTSYMFRDYIGGGDGMSLGSADITISAYDTSTHSFTLSGYDNHVDNNSTTAGYTQANNGVHFNPGSGKMLTVDGHITSIALIKNSNGGDSTYLVKPIGVRAGVDMLVNNTSGNILVLGDAIFSRSDVIAPLLEEGANSAKTYVVTPDLLGQDRSKLVDATHTITTSIDIPSGLSSASTVQGYNTADTTMRFTKGVLAMYHNVDNNFSSSADFGDYLRFLQFSDSGAYQGEHINGGSIGSIKLKSWPMPFVGNMHKVGSSVPSAISGTRHYLARTLYTTDINPADYISFGSGTLSISGTTATLSVTTNQDGVLSTPVSSYTQCCSGSTNTKCS